MARDVNPLSYIGQSFDPTLADRVTDQSKTTGALESALNQLSKRGIEARATADEANKHAIQQALVGKNIDFNDPKALSKLEPIYTGARAGERAQTLGLTATALANLSKDVGLRPVPPEKGTRHTTGSIVGDLPLVQGEAGSIAAARATVPKQRFSTTHTLSKDSTGYDKAKGSFFTQKEGTTTVTEVKGLPVSTEQAADFMARAQRTLDKRFGAQQYAVTDVLHQSNTHIAVTVSPPIDGNDVITIKKSPAQLSLPEKTATQ